MGLRRLPSFDSRRLKNHTGTLTMTAVAEFTFGSATADQVAKNTDMLKVLAQQVRAVLKLPSSKDNTAKVKVTKVGGKAVTNAPVVRRLANTMKVEFEVTGISSSQKAASQKAWNSGDTNDKLKKGVQDAVNANPKLKTAIGSVAVKKEVMVTTTTPSDSAWHKTVGLSLFALLCANHM